MEPFLGYGSPAALEAAIKAGEDESFTVYSEGLIYASVCSSLPFEEVRLRMAQRITGTRAGWVFAESGLFGGQERNPYPCNRYPSTHKHYLFSC